MGNEDEALVGHAPLVGHCLDQVFERRRLSMGTAGIPIFSKVMQCTATAGAQVLQWPMAMTMKPRLFLISAHNCGSSSVYPPFFCLNTVLTSGYAFGEHLLHLLEKEIAVHEPDIHEIDLLPGYAARARHRRERYGGRTSPRVEHLSVFVLGRNAS